GGVAFQPVARTFNEELTKWVLSTNEPTLRVKTILLVSDAFEPSSQMTSDLTIDLDKLRKRLTVGDVPETEPLEALKRDRNPDFFLGRVSFSVKTRAGFVGTTSIGLSVWTNDIPVDEITLPLCVSNDSSRSVCADSTAITTTLNGVDSFRLAEEGGARPDAAIHSIDLGWQEMKGGFHRNACNQCPSVTWSLADRSFPELRDHIEHTTLAAFQDGATDEQRSRVGSGLYNVLFPAETDDGKKAQQAFDEFVQAHTGTQTSVS